MAVQFDSTVIREAADALYRRAQRLVLRYTIFGFVIGGFGGAVAGLGSNFSYWPLSALFCGAFGAYMGSSMAQGKSFQLKLEAQTALCQAQIEHNIRMLAGTMQEATKKAA